MNIAAIKKWEFKYLIDMLIHFLWIYTHKWLTDIFPGFAGIFTMAILNYVPSNCV
jgi:hypothetical protein